MRKWRCVKTENYAFTVGKTYKSDDRGFNIVANDGYCYDRLSACESLKSSNGFEVTKFEEVKEEQIDREDMIDKLDTDYCFCRDCCDCSFNGNCNFEDMSDEDLTSVYNLAFGVKEDKVEEIKEEKKVNKFKVGDVVVGNNSHRYGYTKKGVKCEIIRILRDEKIEVRIIDSSYKGDTLFVVEPEYFDLENPLNSKTLTITTSDSTTTLTDGVITVSVNRYYTDKHDEEIAVNEVVKKYFDEVEMEEKKSKMPKVGDKVRVVDNGRTHSTYDEWLIKNNVNLKSAIKWKIGLSPENGGEYVIKEIHKHEYYDADLALIEDAENAYIINIEGLEVVK